MISFPRGDKTLDGKLMILDPFHLKRTVAYILGVVCYFSQDFSLHCYQKAYRVFDPLNWGILYNNTLDLQTRFTAVVLKVWFLDQ